MRVKETEEKVVIIHEHRAPVSEMDYEHCRQIHKAHGSTYYFASRRFEPQIRRQIDALYGFVRVPDEWVDNPGRLTRENQVNLLQEWREQLQLGINGGEPSHPAMRAFTEVAVLKDIPIKEPLLFIDSMESDLTKNRYETFEDLRVYMRGSAAAVGVMMCYVLDAEIKDETLEAAKSLGEAMQLTNFLRDIGEDADRNRIYIPLEDLRRFGVSEKSLIDKTPDGDFKALMDFEIQRARNLYEQADPGIPLLPEHAQTPVKLARVLYARILDKIEDLHYDVFAQRARTTKLEKVLLALRILIAPNGTNI